MAITAALVKELRESSGAGMMDCKKALSETGGDLEAAVDWLRTKGLSAAAKKSGRIAAEGLVAVAAEGTSAAVVEVNSETDFVARNDSFQAFVGQIANLAAQSSDVDALKAMDFPGTGKNVADQLTDQIATIGENMSIRRMERLSVSSGVVASYIHNAVTAGMGKIGVLVALESAGDADKLNALGRQIAMHIAATNPQSLSVDDLDAEAVAKERNVLVEQARASGKPEEIIDKMVDGRMRKYYQEVVLLEQTSVIDGETQVRKVIEQAGKDMGAEIKLTAFVRMQLGDGIEKKEEDFAAEVAAAVGG